MKIKKGLLCLLSSAIILTSETNLFAQNSGNKKVPTNVVDAKNNFTINYEKPKLDLSLFSIPIGDGGASWTNESCKEIPSEKDKKNVMKVLNAMIKIKTIKDLNLQYRVYIDTLGRPIESMFVDYNCEQKKFTPLEEKVMEKEFPQKYKDIRKFEFDRFNYKKRTVTNGEGKSYKIDSTFTDLQTTYFSIINAIKDAELYKKKMPIKTQIKMFGDSTAYFLDANLENQDKNYLKAVIQIKEEKEKSPSPAYGFDGIILEIDKRNYVPKSAVISLFGGRALIDVDMADYKFK